jgi:WD40 repeat protein/Tfp pilus assembly protein PilF
MGVVYEAEQVSLGRHVALKVLPPHAILNPTYLERFRREAKAAAQLHHTNIVPVFGVGDQDGVYFYAMQFIRGEGLDKVLHDLRRLRRAPVVPPGGELPTGSSFERSMAHGLMTGQFAAPTMAEVGAPPARPGGAPTARVEPKSSSALSAAGSEAEFYRGVARVGLQVAEALAYAHRHGVLHRDVKPSNLLLDAQGTAWVTDFGLAKAEGSEELTQTGDIVGTLRFMAPERFDGRSLPQSDVYALGLTLYELLTLRPAFDDTNKGRLIDKVLHEPPPPPRQLDPHVPRDLETVVLKCLAKDPAERYPSAETLAHDLRRFLGGEPIRARRVWAVERAFKWAKRHPAAAALVAVSGLAVLALVGLAVGLWYSGELQGALHEAKEQRAEAEKQRAAAERQQKQFEDLEAHTRYLRHVSQAEQAWQEARIRETLRLLDLWRPKGADEPDLRGWEWYYLRGLSYKDFRTLETNEVSERYSVAFHPDSRRIAVADWNGKVHVWDVVDGRKLHTLQGHSGRVDEVAFSPDGSQLASASWDRTVRLWDVASGQEIHQFPEKEWVRSVAFSPDGRYLASAGSNRMVVLWDVARRKEIRRFVGHRGAVYGVTFSPDGRRLATAGEDRTARLWDAATGECLRTLVGHKFQVTGVAFSPDSQTLATSSQDYTIKLWDPDTGNLRTTLEGHTSWAFRVAFSPDGRWLASASDDMTVRLWDVISNKEARVFRGHEGHYVRGLAFSPDGRFLATANMSNKVKVWDLASGPQEYRLLHPGHSDRTGGVAFAGDGRRLASVSRDRTVRLWEAATGRQIRILTGHRDEVRCVAFGAGDKFLASGSYDGTVKLWDPDTGRVRHTLTGHKGPIESVAISPNGQWVTAAGDGQTASVWDTTSGQRVHTLTGHTAKVGGVAFSPDGRRLASASVDKTVKLWDTETWQELRTLEGFKEGVNTVAFSPDGRRLATAGGSAEGIKLWDPVTGELVRTLEGLWGGINSVTFSLDGRRLAAAGADQKVKLWDTASGQEVLTLKGHTSIIYSIAFSPDGRWLASAGADREVRLWEAPPDGRTEPEDRAALLTPEYVLRWHLNEAEDCLRADHRSAALWHVNRLGHPPLTDPLLSTRLAAIRVKLGQWAEAIDDADAALRQQADDPNARLLRGQAYQKLGRHAEAVADFTALLTTYPPSAQLYELRAVSHEALGKADLARADREQAIKLGTKKPTALNNEAWRLVTGPAGQRDPARALELIRQAIKQEPDNATFLNTLGVVQYRNGQYKEAVAALEKSLSASKGQSDAFDLFFLAMCHAKLEDATKAKDCFDRAVKWVDGQKNLPAQHAEELKAFRAEAEAVLHPR